MLLRVTINGKPSLAQETKIKKHYKCIRRLLKYLILLIHVYSCQKFLQIEEKTWKRYHNKEQENKNRKITISIKKNLLEGTHPWVFSSLVFC
jgi:hypothetical protein